jgi:hypothetical protein
MQVVSIRGAGDILSGGAEVKSGGGEPPGERGFPAELVR